MRGDCSAFVGALCAMLSFDFLEGNVADQTKEEILQYLQTLIESAVESEQDEPRPFKLETELRIDFLVVKLRELLGG